MRSITRLVQVLVGVLFIISGLVKANDPLGLSYKMQEFFELWNGELASSHFFLKNGLISFLNVFHSQSLPLSVFIITLEIMAGVALLLGWMKNWVLWLLLALVIFFTFLTGYAYLSGKFTNCGCFGDCLPITPLTSFGKDLALLAFILVLLAGRKFIAPVFSPLKRALVLIASLIFSIGLQWYVLNYLPIADCLPFKKGNTIAQQMKPPSGAIPDSFAIQFVYEKEGKKYEFSPENLPADFNTYKFIERKDKLVRKGNADAALKSFALTGLVSGEDSTQIILAQPKALLLFAQPFQTADWTKDLKDITDKAMRQNIPVYFTSSSLTDAMNQFQKMGITHIQYFNCDFTVIRTAARTQLTILALQNGTVAKKYSQHQLNEVITDIDQQKF